MLASKKIVNKEHESLVKELNDVKQKLKVAQQNTRLLEDEFRQNISIKKFQTSPLFLFPTSAYGESGESDGSSLQQIVESNASLQDELVKKGIKLKHAQEIFAKEIERRKAVEVEAALKHLDSAREAARKDSQNAAKVLKVYPQISQFMLTPTGGCQLLLSQQNNGFLSFRSNGSATLWSAADIGSTRPKTAKPIARSNECSDDLIEIAKTIPLPPSLESLNDPSLQPNSDTQAQDNSGPVEEPKLAASKPEDNDEIQQSFAKIQKLLGLYESGVPATRIGVDLMDPFAKTLRVDAVENHLFSEDIGSLLSVYETCRTQIEVFYLPAAENTVKVANVTVTGADLFSKESTSVKLRYRWPIRAKNEKPAAEQRKSFYRPCLSQERRIKVVDETSSNDIEYMLKLVNDTFAKAAAEKRFGRSKFPSSIKIEIVGTVKAPKSVAMKPLLLATLEQVHFAGGTYSGKLVRWCTTSVKKLAPVNITSFLSESSSKRSLVPTAAVAENNLGSRESVAEQAPLEDAEAEKPAETEILKLLVKEASHIVGLLPKAASDSEAHASTVLFHLLEQCTISLLPVFTFAFSPSDHSFVALVAQNKSFDKSNQIKAQLLSMLENASAQSSHKIPELQDFLSVYKNYQQEAFQLVGFDAYAIDHTLWRLPGTLLNEVAEKKILRKYNAEVGNSSDIFWNGPDLAGTLVPAKNGKQAAGKNADADDLNALYKQLPPVTYISHVPDSNRVFCLAHRSGAILALESTYETGSDNGELSLVLVLSSVVPAPQRSVYASVASLTSISVSEPSMADQNQSSDYGQLQSSGLTHGELKHYVAWSRFNGELVSGTLERGASGSWTISNATIHEEAHNLAEPPVQLQRVKSNPNSVIDYPCLPLDKHSDIQFITVPQSEPLLCSISATNVFSISAESSAKPYVAMSLHVNKEATAALKDGTAFQSSIEPFLLHRNKVVVLLNMPKTSSLSKFFKAYNGEDVDLDGTTAEFGSSVSCGLFLCSGKKWCILSIDKLFNYHKQLK